MATTTPNFGWPVPTSTDYVKNGATAIEGLGDAIDASLVYLKGGTTGQVLSKTSNTDMAFTWVTKDGDITEVTAGTGISGGGTSGAVTITNSMATAIDAKGDLIAGTGDNAFVRVAVGADQSVLMADSASSGGVKWSSGANSQIQIASGNLSGASVTVSSISGSYKDLYIVIRNYLPATDNANLRLRMNSDSTANRHRSEANVSSGASAFLATDNQISNGNDNGNGNGLIVVWIPDYANATTWKVNISDSWVNDSTNPTTQYQYARYYGVYNQTGAITSFQLFPSSGNFTSGTYVVYGVN